MLARFLDAYNMIFAVAILKTIGQRTDQISQLYYFFHN